MLKAVLLSTAVLALASSAALALPKGVSVSHDGRTVTVAPGIPSFATATVHDPRASVIFSNIGYKYPKGLYFCCYGETISGPSSELGFQTWPALAFTPSASGTVTKIEAALGYFAGTNGVNLGIYSDSSGLPGSPLYAKDVTNLPNGGGCCTTVKLKIKGGVSVKAGTQYWVVVSTDSKNNDVFGFWNFNSTDQIDGVTEAANGGTGWSSFSGAPAFSVTVFGQ